MRPALMRFALGVVVGAARRVTARSGRQREDPVWGGHEAAAADSDRSMRGPSLRCRRLAGCRGRDVASLVTCPKGVDMIESCGFGGDRLDRLDTTSFAHRPMSSRSSIAAWVRGRSRRSPDGTPVLRPAMEVSSPLAACGPSRSAICRGVVTHSRRDLELLR